MMASLIELLRQLFLEIYRMSGTELIACCIVGTIGYHALRRVYEQQHRFSIGSVLLILWAAAVICSTILGRDCGQSRSFHLIPLYSYREVLMGGSRDILRSNFMNVLLFFPAGLLYTGLAPRHRISGRGMLCTVLVFSLFSMSIELVQFRFCLGQGEMDDVLHNTLGAALGYAAYYLDERIWLPR